MQTALQRSDDISSDDIRGLFSGLKEAAQEYFRNDAHMSEAEITFDSRIDLRYLGQEHSVMVPVAGECGVVEEILDAFHDAHEKTYTFRLDNTPVEFVTFRLTASANVARPEIKKLSVYGRSVAEAKKSDRIVDFADDGRHEAQVYERSKLPPGTELKGPLIVEEATSTTLVHPGQMLRVDDFGFLHMSNA